MLVLVFAFLKSNNCQYIYDTSSVESAKKSESKIAQEKIEEAFGVSNQLVVMVPGGSYESEEGALKEIEKLDYVDSVLGLANVSIMMIICLRIRFHPEIFLS